jgi:hypothetical protein
MKFSPKSALSIFSLLVSMSLVSCEKASLLSPDPGATVPRSNQPLPGTGMPTGGVILTAKPYILDKYGHWTLSYDADGELVKLQSTADPSLIREYSRASNGSGMTILDYNGGKLSAKTLIILDAKGRCKESFITTYGIDNGKPTTSTARYIYFYNSKNQLELIRDQDDSKKYESFSYVDGNLDAIEFWNHGRYGMFHYYYKKPTDPMGQALIPDKNHMNMLYSSLYDEVDEFLPIYGKFHKSLPVRCEYESKVSYVIIDAINYTYKFNSSGYITERENTRHTLPESGYVPDGRTMTETYVFGYK